MAVREIKSHKLLQSVIAVSDSSGFVGTVMAGAIFVRVSSGLLPIGPSVMNPAPVQTKP